MPQIAQNATVSQHYRSWIELQARQHTFYTGRGKPRKKVMGDAWNHRRGSSVNFGGNAYICTKKINKMPNVYIIFIYLKSIFPEFWRANAPCRPSPTPMRGIHWRKNWAINCFIVQRLLQLRFDSTTTKNEHVHFFVTSRCVVVNKKAVCRAYDDVIDLV